LVALGCLGALSRDGIAVALALGGAMLGFAYFNRPTAKLFLGDVGSLPIGLRVWQAHRTHYYQRATDRGFSATEIVARVFTINLGLGALAIATVIAGSLIVNAIALICGAALVGWLLYSFTRRRG